MESYKAWHELARTYPKLMKAFEKLSGEGVGDTALSNVFSQENIGKSSSEIHDTETIGIDIGRNIVDFDVADYIIEKGYNEIGKLVSVKTLFPESVKVDEAFVEQEHPRDGDGQFTDKGGGSTQRGKQEKPTYKKQKSNIDVGYISKKVITKYPQLPKDFVDQQIHESIELRENAGMANKELQNNLNKNLEGVIISGRVKEIESMVGKLARQPENFNTVADLHDVSGVRVMADNLDGINSSLKYIVV